VREEMIVQDFGLKVVLNSVNPAQIKSVDARTFDELTVHTRRGVSHNSPLTAFELDVTRNLLRGITGTSDTPHLPGQITGAASLAMNTPVQLPQLPELGSALITTYKARRYRKHFRFIDDMRAERDPSTIETLDELLLDALKSGEITDMHLAIPEAVDWQEIAGVRFSFKQKGHEPTPDPSISTYRALRNPAAVTIDRLKKDKVQAVSALDPSQLKGQWRVYDCIVFETVHNTYLYVLSGGDWYRVNRSYRESVEAFVRTIPELDVGLPTAIVGDDEGAYNERAAVEFPRFGGHGCLCGYCLWLMLFVCDSLVFARGELPESCVASSAIVEDLDVLEDLTAELGLGRPGAAVDQLLLERREEALGDGVDAPIFVKSEMGRVSG
jgi:uncharacterized protein (TIGR04141 family)